MGYVIAPNARFMAEGETYVWLFRGWQRIVTAQTVAFAADQVLILAICTVAWPFTRRLDYAFALPSSQTTKSLEDKNGETNDDEDDVEGGKNHESETMPRERRQNQQSKKDRKKSES